MGSGCFKYNEKGKGFDSLSKDPRDQSEQGSHGGNIEYKDNVHGREGTKYMDKNYSANNQGDAYAGQPKTQTKCDSKRSGHGKKKRKQDGEKICNEQKSSDVRRSEINHDQSQDDLKKELERLRKDQEKSKEELNKKTEKIKHLEAEKNDLINRFEKGQDELIKKSEEDLNRKSEKIKQLETEKNDHIKRTDKENSKIRTYEEQLNRNKETIKQLEAEKNDLLTRLSSEAAIKMTHNNPHITNLSDQDRPTKLSERYAELYDNQWTDAFEILQTKHNMSDTKAVEILLDILYVSFGKCKEVRKQRDNLEKCIIEYVGAAAGDLTVLGMMDTLKDASKKNLAKILQDYIKTVQEALQKKYHKELQSVSHYLHECVEICLLMNLHNPALELRGCLLKENLPFDLTLFRPYTKSGDRIAYMVWPALQLYKDGPLLSRGVAQGMADSAKGQNTQSSKDRTIKEKHKTTVSVMQKESKSEQIMDRDPTGNNVITKKTDESFAMKEDPVSLHSRDTDKDIKSKQSQHNLDAKSRTSGNSDCPFITLNEKGTNQKEEESNETSIRV